MIYFEDVTYASDQGLQRTFSLRGLCYLVLDSINRQISKLL